MFYVKHFVSYFGCSGGNFCETNVCRQTLDTPFCSENCNFFPFSTFIKYFFAALFGLFWIIRQKADFSEILVRRRFLMFYGKHSFFSRSRIWPVYGCFTANIGFSLWCLPWNTGARDLPLSPLFSGFMHNTKSDCFTIVCRSSSAVGFCRQGLLWLERVNFNKRLNFESDKEVWPFI